MLTPAGLAGGTESYERQSQVSWLRLVVVWSCGAGDDGCDDCDGLDVLQTLLTSSPLISSHLNTLSIHLNLSGTEGREKRKYSNYT